MKTGKEVRQLEKSRNQINETAGPKTEGIITGDQRAQMR